MPDLYNVRVLPTDQGPTPLTEEEERRFRAFLLRELGDKIAAQGWARFPAHTPTDRLRLADIANRLAAHWGRPVFAQAEDDCRVRLYLTGYATAPN